MALSEWSKTAGEIESFSGGHLINIRQSKDRLRAVVSLLIVFYGLKQILFKIEIVSTPIMRKTSHILETGGALTLSRWVSYIYSSHLVHYSEWRCANAANTYWFTENDTAYTRQSRICSHAFSLTVTTISGQQSRRKNLQSMIPECVSSSTQGHMLITSTEQHSEICKGGNIGIRIDCGQYNWSHSWNTVASSHEYQNITKYS